VPLSEVGPAAGIQASVDGQDRPLKFTPPGEPARDFLVQGPADHGIPGLVNLFGIESPGLTSSLALADHVAGMV
jgi:L-2-hydroxyglutarate oxidase LhgO